MNVHWKGLWPRSCKATHVSNRPHTLLRRPLLATLAHQTPHGERAQLASLAAVQYLCRRHHTEIMHKIWTCSLTNDRPPLRSVSRTLPGPCELCVWPPPSPPKGSLLSNGSNSPCWLLDKLCQQCVSNHCRCVCLWTLYRRVHNVFIVICFSKLLLRVMHFAITLVVCFIVQVSTPQFICSIIEGFLGCLQFRAVASSATAVPAPWQTLAQISCAILRTGIAGSEDSIPLSYHQIMPKCLPECFSWLTFSQTP